MRLHGEALPPHASRQATARRAGPEGRGASLHVTHRARWRWAAASGAAAGAHLDRQGNRLAVGVVAADNLDELAAAEDRRALLDVQLRKQPVASGAAHVA